jgi:response regulator RpfG family c-di-GMP phosphodiesterase
MSGEKILVVDDEGLIQQLCRRILLKNGFEVETASSGSHALEMNAKGPYDILLTDIKMPGMSGLELIEKVKERQPEIAAIVITGYGSVDTAIESLKLGVMGFIIKPFTPDALLVTIQNVLEKRRMIRENTRLKLLMPLFDVTRTLTSEVNQKRLLNLILNYAVKETKAEEGSLLILDREGELKKCAVTDFVPNMTGILEDRVVERIAQWTMQHARPLLLHRNSPPRSGWADSAFPGFFENNDLQSILSVPLMKKDQAIGVLNLSKLTNAMPFSEADQDLITILCGQAAVAIENARLFMELQEKTAYLEEAIFDTIGALSQVLETRDCEVQGHSSRMVEYAQAVAERLKLSPNDRTSLRYAILILDIGNVGILDRVLNKPDKLQKEEYEEVKRHVMLGTQIVKRIKFLDGVTPVIYHHHERWDGKGYPDGLAAEKIPLCARIVAVIDAFDAMTSDRPYRKAMPSAEAIAELKRCSGSQFDPAVVEAFLEVLKSKKV